MIFDSDSKRLFADDGRFIKLMECPLVDLPEHLHQFRVPQDQLCHVCDSHVRCLDRLTDEDALLLAQHDPDVCFFATPQAKNLTVLQPRKPKRNVAYHKGLPVIHTARSLETMDIMQKAGYRLVFQDTGIENSFGESKYQVLQHEASGELYVSGDYRMDMRSHPDYVLIKDWFWVRSDRPFPLAAYLLPANLQPGTHVYLDDVIEDIPLERWNQGNADRLECAEATWTGASMDIHVPDDYPCVVG